MTILGDGRAVFYSEKTNTVVFTDLRHPDRGTSFRPKDGKDYVLREINKSKNK